MRVRLLGDHRSRWSGYLQSLPTSTVPLAAFWESILGEDGKRAKSWCRGTEVEKLICRDELEVRRSIPELAYLLIAFARPS